MLSTRILSLGFSPLTCLMSPAAFAGHRQVEQQHFEFAFAHDPHDLMAVAGLIEDLHVARRAKQLLQSLAHDRVIVGNDDADHDARIGGATGRRTSTCVP